MRILFLSAWHPYPPDNGARLRIFNILRGLAEMHDITLLTFSDEDRLANQSELDKICDQVRVLPKKEYKANSGRALLGFFASKPRVLFDRYVPAMDDMIQEELTSGKHDLVIASGIYMADYLFSSTSIPSIYDEVEIGVFTDAVRNSNNVIRRTRNQLTLAKLKTYFRDLLPQFAYSTVVSEIEKQLLKDLIPDYEPLEVIPNGVSLASYREVSEQPQADRLIFTGALTFTPNYNAMQWFTEQVMPIVREANPGAELTITGNHGGKKLPCDQNVNLLGYVNDIRPLIASSWISIAPIFSGGGTRLKILEAFGLQTPVIATSKGAEGLEVQHEEHLLIADSAESFAKETIRLLNNADLRQELVSKAYKLVQEKYDWSVILPKFMALVEKAALNKQR
jgi:glycosyltransferase involved in cell wall biosynthesis